MKNTKINIYFTILILLFLIVGCASENSILATQNANILYVNPQSGLDANLCTQSTPCKTYARAESLAVSGYIIHIDGVSPSIKIRKAGLIVEGGKIDGTGSTVKDQATVMIEANDITIRNMEITGGYSYGWRTKDGVRNITAYNLRVYRNVTENMENISTGKCKQNVSGGWGSAMRAYYADNVNLYDSIYFENCGEGFSSVFSTNVHGRNLILQDNYSVEFYPDQTINMSLVDSYIACINPLFQRTSPKPKTVFLLIGAESGTSVVIRDILFQNNTVYGCAGAGYYAEVSGTPQNINITNNNLYNIVGQVFNVPSNFVISPNVIQNSTLTPNFISQTPNVATVSPSNTVTSTSTNVTISSTPTVTRTKTLTPTFVTITPSNTSTPILGFFKVQISYRGNNKNLNIKDIASSNGKTIGVLYPYFVVEVIQVIYGDDISSANVWAKLGNGMYIPLYHNNTYYTNWRK